MRLPLKVGSNIRSHKLIEPGARLMVALSGGPDSVALLLCLQELSKKRDLGFSLAAAHLNHGLRGPGASRDATFCRKLCAKLNVDFIEARCDTPDAAEDLKRSKEETGRLIRRCFLAKSASIKACRYLAVAHHADDRIETVLYRLCRGTGLAGLEGIGWTGPLSLEGEPDVSHWIEWLQNGKRVDEPVVPGRARFEPVGIVRPMLGCTRDEVLAYLKSKRQRYCTDETNFDTRIPRNALRRLVLPVLEDKVHAGVRAALWRLAEEAELHAERRAWRRGWLDGVAAIGARGFLSLPVPKGGGLPTLDELADVTSLLKALWQSRDGEIGSKHLMALRSLFGPSGVQRQIALPGGLVAERRDGEVWLRKA
ncbi:MAG: tRNA lysidine(34) synthetase TilS [Planctomycetota bacterium]|nr:tRNA lysidine(34) synthetase TilS [Planctomycetota bacterium]